MCSAVPKPATDFPIPHCATRQVWLSATDWGRFSHGAFLLYLNITSTLYNMPHSSNHTHSYKHLLLHTLINRLNSSDLCVLSFHGADKLHRLTLRDSVCWLLNLWLTTWLSQLLLICSRKPKNSVQSFSNQCFPGHMEFIVLILF